jgi:hypothetical protein
MSIDDQSCSRENYSFQFSLPPTRGVTILSCCLTVLFTRMRYILMQKSLQDSLHQPISHPLTYSSSTLLRPPGFGSLQQVSGHLPSVICLLVATQVEMKSCLGILRVSVVTEGRAWSPKTGSEVTVVYTIVKSWMSILLCSWLCSDNGTVSNLLNSAD